MTFVDVVNSALGKFGFDLNWSFWFVLALGLAFALCYWGIRQSTE